MKRLLTGPLAAAATFAVWGSATPTATAQPKSRTVVIENARIVVEPGNVIERGSIVIRAGKIAAVGASVRVPAGAKRVNASGKVVTAGLIEASSRLGMVEVRAVSDTVEGQFSSKGRAVFASYRVADGFNDRSVSIPISRTGGVTSAVTTPRGAFISGIGALASLGSTATGHGSVQRRDLALYINLGRYSLGQNHGSRGMEFARLRELFADARDFTRRRSSFERNQTRRFAATRLDLETLDRVRTQRTPVVMRVHKASDIRAALRLSRELGLRLIIEGGAEAWVVAAELAAAKVPVILDPLNNLPGSFDRLQVRNNGAALLSRAGVDVIVSTTGSVMSMRNLRQYAGVAVAYGLPRDRAWAAITTVPAKVFGLRGRGSLAVGSVADVVVWSGDPLELSTRVERFFVAGVEQSLRHRQTQLLERYRRLPKKPQAKPADLP